MRGTKAMIDNKISNAHLELDRQMAEFLDGKSVAILGRGPSLATCDAEIIESHDVIVRVHRPAPIEDWWPPPLVQPEWQSRVGSRTDILYSSMGTGKRGMDDHQREWINRVCKAFKDEGGVFFCRPHPFYALNTNAVSDFIESVHYDIRFVDVGIYLRLRQLFKTFPFPGTLAVVDILSFNVSELYIGGMTCYCDKSPIGIEESGRKSKCDFNYIRSLWRDNSNVSVDPIMEELFTTVDESVPEKAFSVGDLYKLSDDGVANQYVE